MTDLRLERTFPIAPDRLFDLITTAEALVQWWGPEGVDLAEHSLDFTQTGPWFSVMVGRDSGKRFKVSGQVTHVNAPLSFATTWAWHDDDDVRGDESHVTFTVSATDTGARLVLDHRDLGDDDIAQNHNEGWTSSLNCLAALIT